MGLRVSLATMSTPGGGGVRGPQPIHSPAIRVLCCRACSRSSTCWSSEACPCGPGSPSSATPSRQPGMDEVLMNLPVSAPPCLRAWRACLSASCCVDSFEEAWGGGRGGDGEGAYIVTHTAPHFSPRHTPRSRRAPRPQEGWGGKHHREGSELTARCELVTVTVACSPREMLGREGDV